MPPTFEEAQRLIDKAELAGVDIIEVRFDLFGEWGRLAEIASNGKTPKIASLKLADRGGKFLGTETQQENILVNAAAKGFSYVDIDLGTNNTRKFTTRAKEQGAKVVISYHNFNKTPKKPLLSRILNDEIECGADVCKIVTTVNRAEDNLVLLNFLAANFHKAKIVCFGMGEAGKVSRLLSPVFGGYFTFASLERGAETAAGQMTIDEMKTAYSLLGF